MANSIKSVICLSSILRPSEEACLVFACTQYLVVGCVWGGGGGEGGGRGGGVGRGGVSKWGGWFPLQSSST